MAEAPRGNLKYVYAGLTHTASFEEDEGGINKFLSHGVSCCSAVISQPRLMLLPSNGCSSPATPKLRGTTEIASPVTANSELGWEIAVLCVHGERFSGRNDLRALKKSRI